MVEIAPPPVDIAVERGRIRRRVAVATLVCAGILGTAVHWLPSWFAFPDEMAARLAFVLRAEIFVLLWVLIAVGIVSTIRRYSAPDSRGSAFGPPSPQLAIPIAFLQNTLEQAFIACLTFLSLATVDGEAPLAFVTASVALFAVGRATFLLGYSRGAAARAFGMATTALPSIGAFAWVIWDVANALLGS